MPSLTPPPHPTPHTPSHLLRCHSTVYWAPVGQTIKSPQSCMETDPSKFCHLFTLLSLQTCMTVSSVAHKRYFDKCHFLAILIQCQCCFGPILLSLHRQQLLHSTENSTFWKGMSVNDRIDFVVGWTIPLNLYFPSITMFL